MALYTIKFSVSVDVEMEIEATSETSVLKLIQDNLIMTAGLVDADTVDYTVNEDSIIDLEIQDVDVEQ